MLFCMKCGQDCEEGMTTCPNCGADLKESSKSIKKIKKGFIIAGCTIAILVIGFIGIALYETHQETKLKEKMVSTVQNGYLGNYNMVTIKEVLDNSYEDGEWEGYIRKDNHAKMVEFHEELSDTTIHDYVKHRCQSRRNVGCSVE